jgi:two-component system phosphate regulon sensor histidine kinase PhoR
MLWPFLTILAVCALIAGHLWWRRRLKDTLQQSSVEIERLREKQSQTEARQKAQQEALFNSMAEGVLLLDARGQIQLANRAVISIFGLSADIRSRTLIEALRLKELCEVMEMLDGGRRVIEKEFRLSMPSERWLMVNGAAVRDGAGERQGTVLVFHDLTRQKQLENSRTEFVANVSHELRTPLSLIQGYVETLLGGAKDNPEVAGRFLKTIERNTERLRFLIEDLLVISELESGRVQLNVQSVSFRSLVAKVFEDLKSPAEAKSIRLVDASPELSINADPGRLEQVLSNLVDNGLKYGRNGGEIVVNARLIPGWFEASVTDDGPGIPAEALERIFERFFRVDKARSREQGGTGLGLSIVKHIVQTHGGRVWATSQLGQGAKFFFTLPHSAGEPSAASASPG